MKFNIFSHKISVFVFRVNNAIWGALVSRSIGADLTGLPSSFNIPDELTFVAGRPSPVMRPTKKNTLKLSLALLFAPFYDFVSRVSVLSR